MIIVTESRCTSGACPTQYEGMLSDGNRFYFRYRFGHWSFTITASSDEAAARFWQAGIEEFKRASALGNEMGGQMSSTLVNTIIARCMTEYNAEVGA